jgi:hypothetical protein
LCGENDTEAQRNVLTSLVEKRMNGILICEKFLLDVDDCIAVREIAGGLSTNTLLSVLDSILKLLGTTKLFPTQLKKKIGAREWAELLEVKSTCIAVKVQDGKEANCVFYWVPNVPLLCEMFISSAINDKMQEDLIDFSFYCNMHIFFRGIDWEVNI